MNSNGGLKSTKSKKLESKIKIVGDTPEMTDDIKQTISYLDNIIINKETLKEIDTAKLVSEINKLIQYVEVLSIYKKPTFRLIETYNSVVEQCANNLVPPDALQFLQLKKKVLEELLRDSQLGDVTFDKKDTWRKFE